MVRLYDPTTGKVNLMGSDIKTYGFDEISNLIGFILQDSIIFTGTVSDNILYGNRNIKDKAELEKELKEMDLLTVLKSFKDGLDTKVTTENGGNISNGQKQVIAFLRIILRKPKILILDEATANIDTVTEAVIQNIMDRLPSDTTKIIIAHRLNTIRKADEIYFISGGVVQKALSFESF
jgi:ATP-binding cassette subfamily B protein